MSFEADNGKFVRYEFNHPQLQLTKVVSSDKPDVHYKYDEESRVIFSGDPDGNYLETEYYRYGSNDVGGTPVIINSKGGGHLLGRVMLQRAPVGVNEKKEIVARYFYNCTLDKGGSAEVYDGHNNKTLYHYNADHRLTCIEHFVPCHVRPAKHVVSSIERFYWGANNSQDEANLIAKTICDKHDQVLSCQTFHYDKKGNVLKEGSYGNLSGKDRFGKAQG
ncbi:MAG: hypothetical protein ACI9S8_001015 [Chlamydiales bacterium]